MTDNPWAHAWDEGYAIGWQHGARCIDGSDRPNPYRPIKGHTMTETTAGPNNELRSDIKHALNRASAENPSGTPDHVLADYLLACLVAFDAAVDARSTWRGEWAEFLPAETARCCHTPGGSGIERSNCHRCFVETGGDQPRDFGGSA